MPRHRDSAYRRARPPLLHVIFTNHQLLLSAQSNTSTIPQDIKSYPQNAIWEEIIDLQNLVAGVMETDPGVRERLGKMEKWVEIGGENDLRNDEKNEKLRVWLIWVLDQGEGEPEDGGGVTLKQGSVDREKDAGQSSGENVGGQNADTATVAFSHSRGKLTMRQVGFPANASKGLDLVQLRQQIKRGTVNVTALQEVLDLLIDEYEMQYL